MVWLDRGSNTRSTALEESTLTKCVTLSMRFTHSSRYIVYDDIDINKIKTRNIVETGKIDTPNIQIHGRCLLPWYRNFNKMLARLNEFYWPKPPLLVKWGGSCNCFLHVSKIPTLTYNPGNCVIIKNAIILNIYSLDRD
jgi:hypothetical protein